MQVSIESSSGLQRQLKIGVPADLIEQEVSSRLEQASKSVQLKGFRRGKVPMKVVKQRFGTQIRQEVVGDTLNRSFYQAVTQEKLRPAGQPKIEDVVMEEGKDLEFTASFEVFPEVKIGDLSSISVAKPVAEVVDADIDKMIDVLRQQQAKFEEADKAAEIGDLVVIDFAGKKDGELFEGGSANGTSLELGSGRMIPGFEDGIVGMKAGDAKTLPLTFPADYHSEELKGAAVEFDITVQSVKSKQLPALDESFFAIYGLGGSDEASFRTEVRNNMERELKNAVRNKLKTRVLSQLVDMHSVELPQAMVKAEINNLKAQMIQQYGGGQNIDLNILPDDMFSERAQRRVATGLLVSEVVKQSELKVDGAKVRERVEEIASTYEDPDEVIEYYYSQEHLLHGVEAAVMEDQVVEYILQSASVSEENVGYEEAIQPDPEPTKTAAAEPEQAADTKAKSETEQSASEAADDAPQA